jgi:two-component system OmpR family response regulator
VWGTSEYVDPNIVDKYESTLRKKLSARESTVSIVTVRGVGYRAQVEE